MRRLAVPCAVLALLAGCGGDDRKSTRTITVEHGSPLRIRAKEYSFDPGTVVVNGPGPLTVELHNAGSLPHDIRLHRNGREVGGTSSFPGGQTRSARVRLRPGTYDFLCTVGDHAQLGMRGTLRVRK
jgi:plastocyanin